MRGIDSGKRFLVVAALGALLAVLPAVALGSNSQTFQDSTGEDSSAPDITTVNVSNDDAGAMTFKVNISNRPALTPDMAIVVFLNTDQSTSTGDPNSLGADYVIQLVTGAVDLFQWNGSDFVGGAPQTSLTYSYDATGATIHINASELGHTKSLSFAVSAISGITTDASGNPDFSNIHEDDAPDLGHGF